MKKSTKTNDNINEKLIFKAAELMNALYAAKIALENERNRFQNYNMILQNAAINEHQAQLGIGYLYESQDAVFHPSITAFLNYPRYTLSASLKNVKNTVYIGRLKDCPHDARKLDALLSEYELQVDKVLDFSSEHKSDIDFNIF